MMARGHEKKNMYIRMEPMCTMLGLSCLGGTNNGALLGEGHGL